MKIGTQKKLDEKLISLGKIVSVVSHELKSPLSGIISLVDILIKKQNLDQQTKEYLGLIYKGAIESENIIRNIMNYTKEMHPHTLKNVNVNGLLKNWFSYITKIQTKKISMNIDIVPCYGENIPDILVEETQMREVFTNILLNAIEAVENVSKPKILLQTKCDKRYVYLICIDNGEGISEENMDKIFSPFFTTKKTGVGLGLSTTREIVEKMHGSITIDSQLGKGTTVTIKFPAQENKPSTEPKMSYGL